MHETTDEEEDLIFEICEDYWVKFSKLIGRQLSKAPEHLHPEILMRLQENSSVYGSAYAKYIKK